MNLLAYGGTVAIIGLLIVFTGLIILILAITVMQKIFDAVKGKGKTAPAPAAAPAAVPAAPAPVPAAKPAEAGEPETDPAIIAVIAAAIAAMDGNGRAPVIRSVRRVSGWKQQARLEQISRF